MAISLSRPLDAATIDNSSNATVYSDPISNKYGGGLGIELVFTGTPTSTITLQKSNEFAPDSNTTWIDDGDISITGPSGSAVSVEEEIGNARFLWYRLKIETSSGSGTVTAKVANTSS